ncbi:MAG TPA: MarR family winged helix-turn-helix transcriptional regulator [Gaiellaceae bacterium]|nr:MarR family winged helix-turn-helix transcriptional regulator [Gaiellaceae bacterium]
MNAAKVETLPEKFIASRYPAELVDSTSFLLKKLGFKAKERAFDAFDEIGMNPYHYAVLAALAEDSHETQGALADALGYDRGQMVGILDELEEQELILRRRDPDDRRRQLVSITAEGRRTLTRLRTLSRKLEYELLAPLTEDERARLHELLLKLGRQHLPACAGASR